MGRRDRRLHREGPGRAGGREIQGSALDARDAALDARVLARMNQVLKDYAGEDRHPRHLAKVAGNIRAGLNDFEASEVTYGYRRASRPTRLQLGPGPPRGCR